MCWTLTSQLSKEFLVLPQQVLAASYEEWFRRKYWKLTWNNIIKNNISDYVFKQHILVETVQDTIKPMSYVYFSLGIYNIFKIF